jgi:hypothetical protein
MALTQQQVNLILGLMPVAIDLAGRVADLVGELQAEGYEIPTNDDLIRLNQRLKRLDDVHERNP